MKAKALLLVAATVVLPLTAGAQEDQLSAPIRVVGAAHIEKICNSLIGQAPTLSRADVARGFGRAWTDDMQALRIKANNDARNVCMEGYTGVSFNFIRGHGDRDMAITAGKESVLAATP